MYVYAYESTSFIPYIANLFTPVNHDFGISCLLIKCSIFQYILIKIWNWDMYMIVCLSGFSSYALLSFKPNPNSFILYFATVFDLCQYWILNSFDHIFSITALEIVIAAKLKKKNLLTCACARIWWHVKNDWMTPKA